MLPLKVADPATIEDQPVKTRVIAVAIAILTVACQGGAPAAGRPVLERLHTQLVAPGARASTAGFSRFVESNRRRSASLNRRVQFGQCWQIAEIKLGLLVREIVRIATKIRPPDGR